eukprot:4792942-Prorocentrum_lima.AAC.1
MINSTRTWALEARQPHLLDAAEGAKARWMEAKIEFDGYKADVHAYTRAEIGRDARAREVARANAT